MAETRRNFGLKNTSEQTETAVDVGSTFAATNTLGTQEFLRRGRFLWVSWFGWTSLGVNDYLSCD
jgi:hypothetical protein